MATNASSVTRSLKVKTRRPRLVLGWVTVRCYLAPFVGMELKLRLAAQYIAVSSASVKVRPSVPGAKLLCSDAKITRAGATAVNKLVMDARICSAWRPVDIQLLAPGVHVYRI